MPSLEDPKEMKLPFIRIITAACLGIAIGYVNLTSSQLGYGTGCCSCIMDRGRLKNLLGLKKNPMIVMGIGFKQEGTNRRVHQKDSSYMFETRKKQPIEINYVH